MIETRMCAVCGKELTRREGETAQNYRKRKTCGRECGAVLTVRNNPKANNSYVTLVCAFCDDSFTIRRSENRRNRTCCSQACSVAKRQQDAKAHPSGVRLVCEECQTPFYVPPSTAKQGRKYCSNVCYDKVMASRNITLSCRQCGCSFTMFQSEVERGRLYCSLECSLLAKGSDPTVYGIGIEASCHQCGANYRIKGHQLHVSKYCSRACQHAARRAYRHCDHCGKRYRCRRTRSQFCSTACRGLSQRTEHRLSCAECGTLFDIKNATRVRRYCSEVCRREAVFRKRCKPRIISACLECGRQVARTKNEIGRRGNKYCSPECHHSARRGKTIPVEETRKIKTTCRNPMCQKIWYAFPSTQGPYCCRKCHGDHMIYRSTLRYEKGCVVCGVMLERKSGETAQNYHKRLTCSEECRVQRCSQVQLGGRHRSSPYPLRFSFALRRMVRKRDGHRCRECGTSEGRFRHHVHHIDYVKENCHPLNLITLCKRCHGRTSNPTPKMRKFWIGRYQRMMNEIMDPSEPAA